jgi:hypothetical protein
LLDAIILSNGKNSFPDRKLRFCYRFTHTVIHIFCEELKKGFMANWLRHAAHVPRE